MVERYIVIALKIATTATKGCSITDSTIATTTTTTISVVSIDRLFLFIRFILLACRESCIYIMKISRKISSFCPLLFADLHISLSSSPFNSRQF